MKEHHIFPTLVMSFNLEGKYDKEALVADYVHHDHGLVESPDGESGSSFGYTNSYLNNNTKFHSLLDTLQDCVNAYTEKMSLVDCVITNTWINCYKSGGKAILHRHEASLISGAFYPKIVGKNAGDLILHSPLRPYRMYDIFSDPNELNSYYHSLEAKEGMLYLFPSWCDHETETCQAEERYVLSFNTDYAKNYK
tara:strand:+ start:240 stop:824 length:585 start_codon:yes stop_codon:yes gene_type:complete